MKSLPIAKGRLDRFTVLGGRLLRPELLTENNKFKVGLMVTDVGLAFWLSSFYPPSNLRPIYHFGTIDNYLVSVQFDSFAQAMNRWVNTSESADWP